MTARTCGCGCGASLDGMRAGAVYHSPACRMRVNRAGIANTTRTGHPLREVREAQEAQKSLWSAAIYAEIIRILQVRGRFHADDLEPMGIPDEHRNLIGAQLGSLVARRYIHETGRRKSSNPARKQAKSCVYEFTRIGRERLVGIGAGAAQRAPTSVDPDQPKPLSLLPDGAGQGEPLNPLSHPEAA